MTRIRISKWGSLDVKTPRGRFKIQGPSVLVLTADGEWKVAYSAAYLQEEANLWVQEQTTTRLGLRQIA